MENKVISKKGSEILKKSQKLLCKSCDHEEQTEDQVYIKNALEKKTTLKKKQIKKIVTQSEFAKVSTAERE